MKPETKDLGRKGFLIIFIGVILSSLLPITGSNVRSIIHLASIIISFIGILFLLTAFRKASEDYKEPRIKDNVKKAVLGGAVYFSLVSLHILFKPKLEEGSIASLAVMLFFWSILILISIFWFKASSLISEKSGIDLIKTGALTEIAGVITLPFLVGYIIILAGMVIQFIGWNKIEEKPPQAGA